VPSSPERPLASVRAADAVVAAVLLAAGLLVIVDSMRVGIRWADDGPQAGYFPFYVGVLLAFSSVWTLGAALLRRSGPRVFVTAGALRAIATMLVPTVVYVAILAWLGLYVASFLYIAFFMVAIGRYSWLRSVGVAAAVSVIAFLLFETWFRVPLPKGPLEAALGLQ
jgi:hypothetical protein